MTNQKPTDGNAPTELNDTDLDAVQGAGKGTPNVKGVILSSESHEPNKGIVLSSESHEPSKRIMESGGTGSI